MKPKRGIRIGSFTARAALGSVLLGAAAAAGAAQPPLSDAERNTRLNLRKSEVVDVTVLSSDQVQSMLAITIDGEPVSLLLSPHSLRSAGFEVWIQEPDGALKRFDGPMPPVHTVRGTIPEWDGNVVVGSLVDGKFSGRVRTIDRGEWTVQPLSSVEPGAATARHVVYKSEDVLPVPGACRIDELTVAAEMVATEPPAHFGANVASAPGASADLAETPTTDSRRDLAGTRGTGGVTQISFDVDWEYWQFHGQSINAILDALEAILVGADDIYRSQVGISYVFQRLIVHNVQGGALDSTDPATLLDQLRDQWEDVFGGLERDVVHLVSGKELDGDTIGLAYLAEICNRDGILADGAYSLSQRFGGLASQTAILAHELGHNWSATHCAKISGNMCPTNFPADCGLLCACLGGCNGSLTQFGQPSINQIVAHRNSRDCLEFASSLIYVNRLYSGPEDGTLARPFTTVREGAWAVEPSGTVVVFGGAYQVDRTLQILNRPMRIEQRPGTGVVIFNQ